MSEKAKKEPTVKKTLSFMLKTAWKEKPSLFFAYLGLFLLEFVSTMKNVLLPKFLIDELILVMDGAPVSLHLRRIVVFAALIVGIEALVSVLGSVMERLKNELDVWFDGYFEKMLAEQAMKMDYEHTEDPEALDQLNRAKEGISWYSGGVVGILDQGYQILLNVAVLVSVVTIICVKCPILIPVQFVGILLISMYNERNNRIQKESFLKLAKLNRVFGYVMFRLAGIDYGKDIRLYNSSGMMNAKAQKYSIEQAEVWENQAMKEEKNWWKINVINSLRDCAGYLYLGYLAIKGAISIGDFTMCVSSASELYWSMYRIVDNSMNVRKCCSYAYQFLRFLDYPAAMETGDRNVKAGDHVIEFKDVSFRYPRSENDVLKHVNLKIKAGEHLSIVGLNGAGKTTFIKLLCRLYAVTEGEICIDGVNIMAYSEEEYRRLFAVVFQDFQLFAFTLRENIVLGDADFSEEEIKKVLELSGFYEDAEKLENGLDTVLYKSFDEKGTELSGGQRQKVAISRALYRNAPIVILDEPTAALDPLAEYDIYRKFNDLVGGKTAIYISHRLSSCKFCDHIAVFAQDTIKEYGTHEELLALEDGIYAEMFRTQAKHYVENAG